jgi:hypothetical protein
MLYRTCTSQVVDPDSVTYWIRSGIGNPNPWAGKLSYLVILLFLEMKGKKYY